MLNGSKYIDTSIKQLCETLESKIPIAKDALEYVRVGEYRLALEFLSDWIVDAEPVISLTAEELLKFREFGEKMGLQAPWIDLFPFLNPAEVKLIPKECAAVARSYVASEAAENPERELWLNKVTLVANEIDKSG